MPSNEMRYFAYDPNGRATPAPGRSRGPGKGRSEARSVMATPADRRDVPDLIYLRPENLLVSMS